MRLCTQLADDALKGLREPLVERRIFGDTLLDLRAERMLHDGGARLVVREPLDLLLEVGIEDRDGRHQRADGRVDP